MMVIGTMLKPAEVAAVTQVELRAVNRAIDDRVLPDDLVQTGGVRGLWSAACGLITFYMDAAEDITAVARKRVIQEIGLRLVDHRREEMTEVLQRFRDISVVERGMLKMDLAPYFRAASERMEDLRMAREIVVEDQGILGGLPIVRGTRVPVHDLAASLDAGLTPAQLHEAFPSVSEVWIHLASVYAKANPLRGRPRSRLVPVGAQIVSSTRVARTPRPA